MSVCVCPRKQYTQFLSGGFRKFSLKKDGKLSLLRKSTSGLIARGIL